MIEITGEKFILRFNPESRKISDPMEAWQRARRLLDGYGREDYTAEVSVRVNTFGYLMWEFEVRGPGHTFAWRIPNAWDTWEGIEPMFIRWLADNLPNGCFPPELFGWNFGMRNIESDID